MMNGLIRVGLIGAGANTRLRHIPGFREQRDVEIVAVANRSRESGERIAGEFEIPTVYDNWGRPPERRQHQRCLHRHLAVYAPQSGTGVPGLRQACAHRGADGHERGRGPRDAGRQPACIPTW